MERSVRRAEVVLTVLMLLAIALPSLLGGMGSSRPSDDSRDIASVEDLGDKTACTITGSAFAYLIQELYPNAPVTYVNDWADECIQVDQGKADFLLWEESSIPELTREYPSLMPLPDPVGMLYTSWCTQKTREGKRLLNEINAFLARLQRGGELDELYRKWQDQSTAPDHVEAFPMTGAPKGTLRIVSCLDWTPPVLPER